MSGVYGTSCDVVPGTSACIPGREWQTCLVLLTDCMHIISGSRKKRHGRRMTLNCSVLTLVSAVVVQVSKAEKMMQKKAKAKEFNTKKPLGKEAKNAKRWN